MRIRRVLGAMVVVAALAACGDGVITGGSGTSTEIKVGNNFFSPSTSRVPSGSTVTWTWNAGSALHNVTFDDGPASVNQSSGTYQRDFPTVGSYPYLCTLHGAAMSGTIIVE
ncbi:MAG: plastocyanin/azurin family copper-binding protein [Gemmatimonadaceae bacterium]